MAGGDSNEIFLSEINIASDHETTFSIEKLGQRFESARTPSNFRFVRPVKAGNVDSRFPHQELELRAQGSMPSKENRNVANPLATQQTNLMDQ